MVQVKDLEKRESRLKEVFKTQVSNFREACYCLFGYRVDMASQVCLTTFAHLQKIWQYRTRCALSILVMDARYDERPDVLSLGKCGEHCLHSSRMPLDSACSTSEQGTQV